MFLHELSYHQIEMVAFSELKDKTFTDIKVIKNTNLTNDEIHFFTDKEEWFIFGHLQDCCESVSIEDICGDIQNLLHTPILRAEEVDSEHKNNESEYESQTWTFYKLATIRGWVTIRWYGTSNGYYSERAKLYKINEEE